MQSASAFRKVLKFLGYALGVLLVLVVLGVASAYALSQRRLTKLHQISAASVAVPSGTEAIARGRHIAMTRGCTDCHGKDFAGQAVIDDAMVGHLYGPNLTKGRGGVASDYGDLDYVRAIRHGVSREGRALLLMPSAEYSTLSDEDLGSLIAFLKSLPAVDKARGPVAPGPLARVLITIGEIKLGAEHIDHTATRPAKVAAAPTAEYGRYLSSSCTGCHGDNFGGGKIPGAPPDWPAATNLTSHATAPTAAWTEQDFFNALRQHKRPDGTELNRVMPAAFGQLTDEETKAIWLYLRSVPGIAAGERAH